MEPSILKQNPLYRPHPTGAYLYNPATGERMEEVQEHDPQDVIRMITRAREVQEQWKNQPYPVKKRAALDAAIWIQENAQRIALTIARCTGKIRTEALATEVLPAALGLRHYARRVPLVCKPKKLRSSSILFFNKQSVQYRVPYGVVGIITPWNYPFGIPVHEVATALLTGNGVVLKVATQCQPVGDLIKEMVSSSGFPEGLFQLAHLPGKVAGSVFLHSGIQKLFFTGSTETGKKLMEEAGKQLIPLCLELGGNDAMIVLSDAPLRRAAACAVWAGASNCGQSCGGVERIYIERSVYDPFLTRLRKEVEALRQGPDSESFQVDIGSFTTREQKKKVETQVEGTLQRGGRILASSIRREEPNAGLFYPVQIIEVDSDETVLMQEETFGPILAVSPVDSEDEAIRRANNSNLGLTASVWSVSRNRAKRVANRLQAGVVTLNDHLLSHGMAETPWGGFKQSGIGRSHGDAGIEEMTQIQVVIRERFPRLSRNIFWQPYSEVVYNGLLGALDMIAAPAFHTKVKGAVRLVKLVISRLFS